MIWHFIMDNLTWLIWGALAVAGFVLFGWRGAIAFATAGLAWVIYRQGRKDGESAVRSQQQAKELQDVQTVQKNKTSAHALPDDQLDEEVDKWTRG